jgi:hypothetical protein
MSVTSGTGQAPALALIVLTLKKYGPWFWLTRPHVCMCPLVPWLARTFKKSYLKNEKELGHSENGYWRLVMAIYTPFSSVVFLLVTLHGNSPLALMSGPKRNPPYPPSQLNFYNVIFIYVFHAIHIVLLYGLGAWCRTVYGTVQSTGCAAPYWRIWYFVSLGCAHSTGTPHVGNPMHLVHSTGTAR